MSSKNLISCLLAFSLSVAALSDTACGIMTVSVTASAETVDDSYSVYGDWQYTVKNDGTVAINRYMGVDKDITVPSTINGDTVTELDGWGGDAITGSGYYTGVKISAFQNTDIKSVVIPDTVKTMEYQMFDSCDELERIVFGNSLEEIPDMTCFRNTSLKEVTIGSAVKKIGRYAFDGCPNLTKLIVSDSVTDIEDRAFGFIDGKVNKSFTVYCAYGSATYNYAVKNGIKYVITDGDSDLKVGKVIIKDFSSDTVSVRIKWGKVLKASGYRIYQYDPSSKKWKSIKTLSGKNVTYYKISGLRPGKGYYFKVKAYRKADENTIWGKASDKLVTATKPESVSLSATSLSKNWVKLSWNKVSCTGYTLQKYDALTKKWKNLKTVSSAIKSYTVKGLKKNTSYKFRIRAYKKVGDTTVAYGSWITKKVKTKV